MDFVAVVDQAIALLRQRGRLTYRTLQLQFQLDAEHLEALTDELIKGQRLATDEDGASWSGWGTWPQTPASPLPSTLHPCLPLHATALACPASPRRNAASSPCCSVTWWTPPPSPAARPRRPARGGAGLSRHLRQGDRPL